MSIYLYLNIYVHTYTCIYIYTHELQSALIRLSLPHIHKEIHTRAHTYRISIQIYIHINAIHSRRLKTTSLAWKRIKTSDAKDTLKTNLHTLRHPKTP